MTPERRWPTRMTSELSMAMSVPAPMAMPTSACMRAGLVDAVPDHGHPVTLGLEAPHPLGLGLGQDLGVDLGDAHPLGLRLWRCVRCRR
jgi:hypothetical protein